MASAAEDHVVPRIAADPVPEFGSGDGVVALTAVNVDLDASPTAGFEDDRVVASAQIDGEGVNLLARLLVGDAVENGLDGVGVPAFGLDNELVGGLGGVDGLASVIDMGTEELAGLEGFDGDVHSPG